MDQKSRLLELRKKMKKKKPSFRRVESWRYVRVKDSWRKARGIDSKTRKKTKSGVKSPSAGYRTPKKIRGMHPSGYEEVQVEVLDDFIGLSSKKHAIKLSRRLGSKKRLELIDYAQKRNFRVLNIGLSLKELEKYEAMLEAPIEGLDDDEYLDEDELEESIDFED
ncbi:MAG: 50S ribosomal protein L32e [Candidatus Hermodarchaeota archaeon]